MSKSTEDSDLKEQTKSENSSTSLNTLTLRVKKITPKYTFTTLMSKEPLLKEQPKKSVKKNTIRLQELPDF